MELNIKKSYTKEKIYKNDSSTCFASLNTPINKIKGFMEIIAEKQQFSSCKPFFTVREKKYEESDKNLNDNINIKKVGKKEKKNLIKSSSEYKNLKSNQKPYLYEYIKDFDNIIEEKIIKKKQNVIKVEKQFNKNINSFKKVYTINDNKTKTLRKNKSIHVPTVNIDLTNSRKDINNKNIINNKTSLNNSYNQKFIKPTPSLSNSFFKNYKQNGIYNSYRNSIKNIKNNPQIHSNNNRYIYKSPNITDYNIIKNNNSNNNDKEDNKVINKTHKKVISDHNPNKYISNYNNNSNKNYNKYNS